MRRRGAEYGYSSLRLAEAVTAFGGSGLAGALVVGRANVAARGGRAVRLALPVTTARLVRYERRFRSDLGRAPHLHRALRDGVGRDGRVDHRLLLVGRERGRAR